MKTIKEVRETLKANKVKGVSVRSGSGSTIGQIIVCINSHATHTAEFVKSVLVYTNPLKTNLFIQ